MRDSVFFWNDEEEEEEEERARATRYFKLKPNEVFANGFYVNALSPEEWIEAGSPEYKSQEGVEALLHFRWDSWHIIGVNDKEPHTPEYCSYCDRHSSVEA